MILSEESIDESKFAEVFEGSLDDLKSSYSCVRFLLLSAVRYNVGTSFFSTELQQLGLPREHSLSLEKVLDENSLTLREYLKSKTLSINELEDVKFTEAPDATNCIRMEMKVKNSLTKKDQLVMNIKKSDIPILLKELKILKAKMEELNED